MWNSIKFIAKRMLKIMQKLWVWFFIDVSDQYTVLNFFVANLLFWKDLLHRRLVFWIWFWRHYINDCLSRFSWLLIGFRWEIVRSNFGEFLWFCFEGFGGAWLGLLWWLFNLFLLQILILFRVSILFLSWQVLNELIFGFNKLLSISG